MTEQEASAFKEFVGLSNEPSFNMFIYAKLGQLSHLEQDPGYQATMKVLDKIGLGGIEFSKKTAMPYEEQFWEFFDLAFALNEEELLRELPKFVTDPSNKAKVEALYSGKRGAEAVAAEETKRIEAKLE